MTTGRKPLPAALRIMNGSKGPLPNNPEPPRFEAPPDPPPHLGPLAVQEWHRLAGPLVACGVLTVADTASFAAYCASYARWAEAEEKLRELGQIVKSANGFPIQNPHLVVANAALKQMHVYAAELGLTPSSRSRVTRQAPKPRDPFADFLAKKPKAKA